MKSSKTPRPPLQKTRLSRETTSSHGTLASPTTGAAIDPSADDLRPNVPRKQSETASPIRSMAVHTQVTTVLAQDSQGLEVMRRRMDTSPSENMSPKRLKSAANLSEGSSHATSTESLPSTSATISTDSARTVRAPFDATPGTVRTPSYPFPRMNMRLQRGLSSRSGPHHRPFTLLSPTNEPPEMHGMEIERRDSAAMNSASETSTPMGQETLQAYPEDPNHPTPDLYDMVLMLSTEPGLESWWANVTEMLTEAYGAERASLALPGDITDLENVPWGQKASFGINGSDSGDSTNVGSNVASEADNVSLVGELGSAGFGTERAGLPRRPPLTTRHSIAGLSPEKASKMSPMRPHGPTRAISTMSGFQQPQGDLSSIPKLTKQSPTPQVSQAEEDLNVSSRQDLLSTATSAPRCYVYRTLQRLEAEPDPLLVRTGVSTLFGKRKPVVLTRAYSDERSHAPQKENWYAKQPYRERESSTATVRAFEEYEQPEPSPWSQSPSPSPAARPDPAESPFFTQSATVDEDAFSPNPPSYNYGASANQSLNAIGTDSSKTLIHIPLIQPVPSRKVLVSSLRFPVAILSFLSPVTPYPRNLRHSLYALLPHLASTFSLAHQFSNMQERLRGGGPRAGSSFGLGGTFSDEGSELELVTELSTQIQHEKALSKASSLAGSVYSPSDRASVPRTSPPGSIAGTPLLDEVGMNSHFPPTPSKGGSEMVEGYFSAKRNRSGILNAGKQAAPTTPGGRNTKEVSPERQRKPDRAQQVPQSSSKKQNVSVDTNKGRSEAQNHNSRSASLTSEASYEQTPTSGVDRIEFRRLLHRDSLKPEEGERNLPELIAALMLNAVPLQLFLAKPSNGDLVWTNRKFDAFRSQGEGRVKDPWKNVHSEDQPDLTKMWKQALRTGNQFTHYIRVKRFNSDSDFRWFVFRASTMLSNNGRLLYWVGSFLDVHEQYVKNLEAQDMQATMARDSKIRALADAIPQVLFEAVEGEGIVSVNQQWHTFSGQTLDEARGVGFARHVHRDDLHKCGMLAPADVPRAASESSQSTTSSQRTVQGSHRRSRSLFAPDDAALATMIQQGSVTAEKDENGRVSYTTEIRLRSKKGEFRWFLVRLVKVEDGNASWYGTCTDIELRMNLERDLNEANKKVHMEMESKTKFFANMSHEIRTPLNGILGSMPWLVESQLDHDQRRTLDTIQNSANNLRELVDNILDVTKVEAGKMTLLPKWFDVRSLCEEVVDTCSSRAIERGLELNYTLCPDVPSTVKGDPFRLRQVLLNLMGNSVKFTQEGEVYLRCGMKVQPTANETFALLNFDVVDTGRGFNESEFKRLFKQFGQIEGASQHDAGSGLGLFLSKQLVEMHGGELSVTSKVGEGSTFSFFIRVETTAPGQQEVSAEHPLRPSHRHSVSFGTSPSHSGAGTPTLPASSKTVVHTPGLSKYVSPPAETPAPPSPAVTSPFGVSDGSASVVSFRTASNTVVTPPSLPSNLPTPESIVGAKSSTSNISDRLASIPSVIDSRSGSLPSLHRAQSDNYAVKAVNSDAAHPQTYSIVVICPMEHARLAIKQHIEHVVPHQIPVNVTALSNINAFLELRHGPSPPTFTHIVLDLPASSDIMLFMRQIATFSAAVVPALVIVTDHYQKRDIAEDFMTLTSTGKKAFLVHKPVKPSVFAMIFDPAQLRNLSKDRVREVAQNSSDDFKKIANHVKDTIGKKFRLLLVEDSDTNRMVIQRYLKRVELASDEARDGQECVDKVRARPHGYYNLIICDIQMPKKNGYEACVEIRQWERENAYPSVPIMALTANAMPEERAAAGAAGFSDYLTKPVDFNRLGRMMITLLDPSIPHTSLKDQNVDTGRSA
ncbi:hypothetical protein LTR70_002465 [Exophiala xenobiotica]|uniref:histidine kinase n=1 Tax=Lithohypha guttulata TaxID=1690604 RepID=A0ABR0KLS1_9EURO|nr:hypothetical protein LTR24_001683 [Lithohypha guttulata]KAK5325300.1 hypothetical protein LTR70_002465 [Exophiala xenobiotica]